MYSSTLIIKRIGKVIESCHKKNPVENEKKFLEYALTNHMHSLNSVNHSCENIIG
jgi:hypothetical protein